MEYKLNILGEFKDKDVENVFMEREVKKGLTLIRYVVLLSAVVNLLFGITDYLFLKSIMGVLCLDYAVRIAILALAIIMFIFMNRVKNIKAIGVLTCSLALFMYGSHLFVATYFTPVNIMYETFNLVILSTCLFLIPNRWVINLASMLVFLILYIIMVPHLCTQTGLGDRIITLAYLFWNTIVISVLFYRINMYKRNQFSKELHLGLIADTDHLTKLYNRKAFDDILEGFCTNNTIFSFIIFDIDDFKLINDTYGHVVGDDVIVSITKDVKNIMRKDDIVARWGGEEFVILMPGVNLPEATELAKRVKEQISLIRYNIIKHSITCSFGVTSFIVGDNSKSIIIRADHLLYLAKEHGKDKVVAG